MKSSLTRNRSNDGLTLVMSSSDGFCSTLSFAPGELGQVYSGSTSAASNTASTPNATPLPTPTHAPSPIKPAHATPSSGGSASHAPPASPARSNSACSVATQSSIQQPANVAIVNNPTPTLGSVPLVTATHSAQPSTLPLTTPPQTPLPTGSQGGASVSSGSVLGKRDTRTASESEKEESKDSESADSSQRPKKRRVAPTLVSVCIPPPKDNGQ